MILQKQIDLSAEFETDDIEAESGANNVKSVMFSNLDAEQSSHCGWFYLHSDNCSYKRPNCPIS